MSKKAVINNKEMLQALNNSAFKGVLQGLCASYNALGWVKAEFNATKVTFTDKKGNRVIFEVGNKAFEKEIAEVEEMLAMEDPDCEDLEADED